ncbi:MAG: hypothetical protein AAFP03_11005, partial [Cyanobacteria bacterium J06598_3]
TDSKETEPETTEPETLTLEPVVSEPVVPDFSPSETASPITIPEDDAVAAESTSQALPVPDDDEPSPFIPEGQKPKGLPINLWVLFVLVAVLGGIFIWGWIQLTSTEVTPLPGTSEVDPTP